MARKKEVNYFDILITASNYSNQTACEMNNLLNNFVNVGEKAAAIHDLEHAADYECHCMFDALNTAFITPIDREDLYDLIKSIDDITDLIEDVANRLHMFNVTKIRPEAFKFGALMETSTKMLYELLQSFKTHKRSQKQIHEMVKDINTLEEQGDQLYRDVIRDLFLNEKDVLEIIKWKDIYDDMENVLDACEDVADIIQGVVMKHN